MTLVYWVGPGSRKAPPADGSFTVGANWSTGVAPDTTAQGQSEVVLRSGDYIVTWDGGGRLQSLSVGVGATLAVTSATAPLELVALSVVEGTLSVGGATTTIDDRLLNLGTLTSAIGGARIAGGTIVNAGDIRVTADGGMAITSTIRNDAGGTILVTTSAALQGFVTNQGLIAVDGGLVRFSPTTGGLTNLANGVLSGGSYAVSDGGELYIYQAPIRALVAGTEVTLDGAGSNIFGIESGVARSLDGSLERIDVGATLRVLGDRDYTSSPRFQLDGALDLGGGTFTTAQLTMRDGSLLTGFGTIAGRAEIAGDIVATGALTFTERVYLTGMVSGRGTLVLDGDATLAPDALTVANLVLAGNTRIDVDVSYARHLTVTDTILDFRDHELRLTGSVDLADATIRGGAPGALRLGGELHSTGASVLDAVVVNTGTITVAEGTLEVSSRVDGAGTFAIGDEATLEFGLDAVVGARQRVGFADGEGTLRIEDPSAFRGALSAFGSGDTVVLDGIGADGARLRWIADDDGIGGTLRVIGTERSARLHFADGTYTRADFVLGDDGSGAVMVTGASRLAPTVFADADVIHAHLAPGLDLAPNDLFVL